VLLERGGMKRNYFNVIFVLKEMFVRFFCVCNLIEKLSGSDERKRTVQVITEKPDEKSKKKGSESFYDRIRIENSRERNVEKE
jgi:hypothetical protein